MRARFDEEYYKVLEEFFAPEYKSLDAAYGGLKTLQDNNLISPENAERIKFELNALLDKDFQFCCVEDGEQFYRRSHDAGFYIEESYDYTVMPDGSRRLAYTLGVFKY